MAKVHARGRTIVGTIEFTASAKRYMSDGIILKPDGCGSWRIGGKLKAGVTPVAAYEKQIAYQRETLSRYPSLAAYRAALHAKCGLHKRARLHLAIELMPDDPDGVWSECCDGYGDNVHADLDDIVRLCALYRAYEQYDKPRIIADRTAEKTAA